MHDDDESEASTTPHPWTVFLSLVFVGLLSSALTLLLLPTWTSVQYTPSLSASLAPLRCSSSAPPSDIDGSAGFTADERVARHELCRLSDPSAAALDLKCNLTPLPAANISLLRLTGGWNDSHASRAGLLPSEMFDSWPHYLELYVQEVFVDQQRQEVRVGVLALADNHRVEKRFWNSTGYRQLIYLISSQLTLTVHTALNSPHQTPLPLAFIRDSRAVPVNDHRLPGIFWLHFQRQQLREAAERLPERLDLTLHHPAMLSSTSTDCVAPTSTDTAATLRFSICEYAYRPVTFSYCSAELRTSDLLPHLRYFLTYHAYLGVHRFVIYDRGFYASVLRPFVEAGLVEYRYWPWLNRDFTTRMPADWSQVTLISLCSEFQQDISTYYGLFDPDEWLTLPQTELPSTQLQGATPLAADFNRSLPLQPFPSNCLSFSHQPAARDPDVSFDLSLVRHARYPLQQCHSMLEQTVSELRRQSQQRMLSERQELLYQLLNQTQRLEAGDSHEPRASLSGLIRRVEESIHTPQDMLHVLPIFAYNFMDTKDRAANRRAEELAAQQQYVEQLQHNNSSNVSFPLTYFASAPERFNTRQMQYRTVGAHKAFYLTSANLHPWIHPLVDRATFINPNVLRFHHFVSMAKARWNDKEEVSTQQTQTQRPHRTDPAAALTPLTRRQQRCSLSASSCTPFCIRIARPWSRTVTRCLSWRSCLH